MERNIRRASTEARTSAGGVPTTPQPKAPEEGAVGAMRRRALQTGLHAIADVWAGEVRRRVRQLAKGDQAAAAGAPALIHDLRIHVRRFCALSDLLPRRGRGRSAMRALRKEVAWAMQPLSRARDWDVLAAEILPRLFDAESDLDREATGQRAAARSAVAHGEMYVHLRSERFQGVLEQFQERDSDMHAVVADSSAKELYARIRSKLERWHEKARDRLAGKPAMRDARVQHQARTQIERLRYASEGLMQVCSFRKLERYVQSLEKLQAALGDVQDLRMAARLGPVVCVSLSSGKLADASSRKACRRMLGKAEAALRAARRRFMRQPSFWADAGWEKFSGRLAQATSGAQAASK
ncbi:CHAD domain-containing protein [Achromobacter anxifer]|uniref:CHAD domain-containing protein n=1 Tax=Achromobacter anxifer TaxID=1287737 RepID=UPI0021576ED3|nr:CHAD domain-containing protein [Achromobacter anxifer]